VGEAESASRKGLCLPVLYVYPKEAIEAIEAILYLCIRLSPSVRTCTVQVHMAVTSYRSLGKLNTIVIVIRMRDRSSNKFTSAEIATRAKAFNIVQYVMVRNY